jgi:hypothetical protein
MDISHNAARAKGHAEIFADNIQADLITRGRRLPAEHRSGPLLAQSPISSSAGSKPPRNWPYGGPGGSRGKRGRDREIARPCRSSSRERQQVSGSTVRASQALQRHPDDTEEVTESAILVSGWRYRTGARHRR